MYVEKNFLKPRSLWNRGEGMHRKLNLPMGFFDGKPYIRQPMVCQGTCSRCHMETTFRPFLS